MIYLLFFNINWKNFLKIIPIFMCLNNLNMKSWTLLLRKLNLYKVYESLNYIYFRSKIIIKYKLSINKQLFGDVWVFKHDLHLKAIFIIDIVQYSYFSINLKNSWLFILRGEFFIGGEFFFSIN